MQAAVKRGMSLEDFVAFVIEETEKRWLWKNKKEVFVPVILNERF